MKIASLFDGIGGAVLCAERCGVEAVWSSEIEPFPQKVTQYHFPQVKHLGDITKINGALVEPVDIIVGGSPCQDLSVAGKRAGMKHTEFGDEETTRSGLFMEQIRIVKEMRNATGSNYPRYMVWENVPGAFSSNGGEDFRAVLEETARVSDSTISIPRSPTGWANSGSILGDGFSISWRTIDAQYFGVPQRRRRIYLVADFRGQSAPEILFEREIVRGDIKASGTEGKEAAENVDGCSSGTICFEPGAITRDMGVRHWEEISPTLRAEAFDNHPAICVQGSMIGRADKNGGNPACNQGGMMVVKPAITNYQKTVGALCASDRKGIGNQYVSDDKCVVCLNRVRRLTPLECERLQGYPDGWTDIPGASDSARCKALGNSFAIPCAEFVIRGIKEATQ